MFESAGFVALVESTSVTKKSLNGVHTYSGYPADMKYMSTENDCALVGTRSRIRRLTESNAVVFPGTAHPGALGKAPPLSATQPAGAGTSRPMSKPGSQLPGNIGLT